MLYDKLSIVSLNLIYIIIRTWRIIQILLYSYTWYFFKLGSSALYKIKLYCKRNKGKSSLTRLLNIMYHISEQAVDLLESRNGSLSASINNNFIAAVLSCFAVYLRECESDQPIQKRIWSAVDQRRCIRDHGRGESAFKLAARIQFFSWKYRWHDGSTVTGYCLSS